MSDVRPLFVSTFPPQACGLATFTQDVADNVDAALASAGSLIAAVRKYPGIRFKDRRVVLIIDNAEPGAYERAGHAISETPADVVCIQHEFGLYPGDWGAAILDLVRTCRKPIVTVLHTLATRPATAARRIVRHLAHASELVVVMSETSVDLLGSAYGLPDTPVTVIPHGVPDVRFVHRPTLRQEWNLSGRRVLCTFGLLSRGKNIETAIQALPRILTAFPDVLYVVAGQTHPGVRAHEGEAYREELANLARQLGVDHAVRFVDRYLGRRELMDLLQACDVYVVPYGGRDQVVSGTLAYAMAAGCAIVSTPFLYAAEVLGQGRGILFDFADSAGLAEAVTLLLRSGRFCEGLQASAYEYARRMIWPAVGGQYLAAFRRVVGLPADVAEDSGLEHPSHPMTSPS